MPTTANRCAQNFLAGQPAIIRCEKFLLLAAQLSAASVGRKEKRGGVYQFFGTARGTLLNSKSSSSWTFMSGINWT